MGCIFRASRHGESGQFLSFLHVSEIQKRSCSNLLPHPAGNSAQIIRILSAHSSQLPGVPWLKETSALCPSYATKIFLPKNDAV